ncbi:hypothetical protein [Spirosoma endbachense]|uniref:Uncharacterized protein n=1 Tax=Spirosoma endbachense TaxID=2666025 RepID=A0A6P1VQS9_9BACT|nr:hypothetical protein [Spirosoma endbachense]QHV94340.1 hypothetical protein GJR95_04585 [Spirosoma endbachense]
MKAAYSVSLFIQGMRIALAILFGALVLVTMLILLPGFILILALSSFDQRQEILYGNEQVASIFSVDPIASSN